MILKGVNIKIRERSNLEVDQHDGKHAAYRDNREEGILAKIETGNLGMDQHFSTVQSFFNTFLQLVHYLLYLSVL